MVLRTHVFHTCFTQTYSQLHVVTDCES